MRMRERRLPPVGRRLTSTRRGIAAAGIVAALGVTVPAGAARAQTPVVPPLSTMPSAPLLPPAATALAEAALAAPPAVVQWPVGGQFARGPTLIGDVFNGGGVAVVSNGGALNSGNVINSP